MRIALYGLLCLLWCGGTAAPASAADPTPSPTTQPTAPASPATPADEEIEVTDLLAEERARPFDPEAATEAYLARVSPEDRARSDAYFEGGYWLQLWVFLYGLGVAWLLLGTGLSARLRSLAERITGRRPLHTWLYAVAYVLLTALLTLPLTIYTGYYREHQYGLATQTFGPWLLDLVKGLGVALVFVPLLISGFYGALRRAPRTWWVWGSVLLIAFLIVGVLISPVFIDPLFNEYTPLAPGPLRDDILALARANAIPADEVYVVDASRQTTRISANVSGLGGTMRIALNDNLLNRTSPAEIESVMGHEMGHYALNHIYELILELGLVIVIGFAFLSWSFGRAVARWGARWGIRDTGDVAGLPLLAALFSVWFFLMTPITNTIIRVNEVEADIYGLNAARQPDGFAEVALKLGEYRKLAPGPVEEWIFFDHPSGKNRILMAMRWKAEHRDQR